MRNGEAEILLAAENLFFSDLLTSAQLNSGFKLTCRNRLWSKKTKKKAEIDATRRAENNDDIITLSFLHVNQGSSYNYKKHGGRK